MVALKVPTRGTASGSTIKKTTATHTNATCNPNTTQEALCTSNPIILGLRMAAGTSTKESSLKLAHACRTKAALFVRMSHAANARKAALAASVIDLTEVSTRRMDAEIKTKVISLLIASAARLQSTVTPQRRSLLVTKL